MGPALTFDSLQTPGTNRKCPRAGRHGRMVSEERLVVIKTMPPPVSHPSGFTPLRLWHICPTPILHLVLWSLSVRACPGGELPRESARQQGQRQEVLDILMPPAQIDGMAFSEAVMQNIRGNSERIEFCKRGRRDGKCPATGGTRWHSPGALGDSV